MNITKVRWAPGRGTAAAPSSSPQRPSGARRNAAHIRGIRKTCPTRSASRCPTNDAGPGCWSAEANDSTAKLRQRRQSRSDILLDRGGIPAMHIPKQSPATLEQRSTSAGSREGIGAALRSVFTTRSDDDTAALDDLLDRLNGMPAK